MVKAKKWVFAKKFDGHPDESNFSLVEEELPELKDGEVLCEAIYLSVDPYMRVVYHSMEYNVGDVLIGQQVAKVTASKHAGFPVGCLVLVYAGWRTHTNMNGDDPTTHMGDPMIKKITEHQQSLDLSYSLGSVGMPGATAYFCLTDCLKIKAGETLFVNAAAGAVGSLVGQIGKIMGCRVIGCAGNKKKCDWLKELGFDFVFDYKKENLDEALKKGAPDGIDCYFDNVGGNFSVTVINNHMKTYGRAAIVGSISTYSSPNATGPFVWVSILMKQLTVKGFFIYSYSDQFPTAYKALAQWIKEGKLKVKEHRTEGFKKMPQAFLELFKGTNIGKAIVKV